MREIKVDAENGNLASWTREKVEVHSNAPWTCGTTLEFLDKKHSNFDQRLDFLISAWGNRSKNKETPEKIPSEK